MSKAQSSTEKKPRRIRGKKRYAEILGVFTRHNFYINGFTPEEMRTTLEELGPTFVKIGQIMSGRSDILPESYCRELAKLRSSVKPLDAGVVRAVIEQETGQKIDELFSEFRDEPLGSASIAQAHYGRLKDGTRVVIKIQRPNVADMMREDLDMLKKIAQVANAATETDNGSTLDLVSVINELARVSEDEIDFRVEAENTRIFRRECIENEDKISCPSIIDELSTERILTMTYIDGYAISKRERALEDGLDCNEIGKTIVENYIHQVLDVGIFHGDPHQGNIMISGGIPYWIDFGMIGRLSSSSIDSVQSVILAFLKKDTGEFVDAALAMGTPPADIDKGRFTDDAEVLIEKYSSSKSLEKLDMGVLMTELMQILKRYNIPIPGEYTMLVRSLVTIEGVLGEFCPELNLFDFVMEKMTDRIRKNTDIQSKIKDLLQLSAAEGLKAVKLPNILFNILRNLSKGRLKINFEVSSGKEVSNVIRIFVKSAILSMFASIMFLGSCILCVCDIEPKIRGIPAVAFGGFVFSTALGIYTMKLLSSIDDH